MNVILMIDDIMRIIIKQTDKVVTTLGDEISILEHAGKRDLIQRLS